MMPETCLAAGCNVKLPRWTKLCADHMWMNTVEVATGRAVTDTFNGRYRDAIDELEKAIDRIREEGRG